MRRSTIGTTASSVASPATQAISLHGRRHERGSRSGFSGSPSGGPCHPGSRTKPTNIAPRTYRLDRAPRRRLPAARTEGDAPAVVQFVDLLAAVREVQK